MSELALNIVTVVLCLAGVVFFVGATVGLVRFPDLYTRLHPVTMGDTLGASLIVFALSLRAGIGFDTLKLVAILLFLFLSSATCSHAIARSAFLRRIEPWHRPEVAPWPDGGPPPDDAPLEEGDER